MGGTELTSANQVLAAANQVLAGNQEIITFKVFYS
jgi:hypothetical protein